MGYWSNLLGAFRGEVALFTPNVTHLGAPDFAALVDPSAMTAAEMWRTQPHFRTVVSFMARNIAQLGLHTFEMVDQSDRRRDRTSPIARALRAPDGVMTEYELKFALVGDLCLYDRAYWWAAPSSATTSGWMLRRLPPTWVEPVMKNAWDVDHYRVYITANGQPTKIPTDAILAFPGYNPGTMVGASPTVDALRETLREQVEAAVYRSQVWKRGGRVSAVLERPQDAPAWSDGARESFREDWYAKYTGKGPKAGGTPILEDGMTLKRVDFSAQEQQFVEAAKLSLVTVASAFHINPTMVGQNDGANYSNVREFRKMLYGETLGPLIAQVEDRLNSFLLPRMGMDPARFYVEFNIDEKLQGAFEEQAASLQASTGAPWMTRNEARALRNLPAITGGDALVTPLNVLVGGQASPTDSGLQNVNAVPAPLAKAAAQLTRDAPDAPLRVKAGPRDEDTAAAREVLVRFFNRQRAAVLARLGAKADAAWWDEERWNTELADDLYALAMTVTAQIGPEVLTGLGVEPDLYVPARTEKFLRAVAESRAGAINSTTRDQIEAALAGDVGDDADKATPAGVFDEAAGSRADLAAVTLATTLAAFAVVEAGHQLGRPDTTKTWVATPSPNSRHARLDGQTVGIDDRFSNGMAWPGDPAGGVDEVAGCRCTVQIAIP